MTQIPRAWLVAGVSQPKTATNVTAKLDMGADVAGKGLCPECKKPMIVASAGGNKVWACVADRISLPMPDDATTKV